MRLTKRQLKRIIREEYSRLKRRGLIRESQGPQSDELESILEAVIDEVCTAETIRLIMNCDEGSELKAKAFQRGGAVKSDIQDIIADMRQEWNVHPEVTLDALASFDRNILQRILDDSV